MPRLSIIIPTLGDWEALENTLVSVLQNRPPRCEVVIVHNRPYNDPYDLRDEVRFVEAPIRSRLVDLINIGAAAAESDVLHVLACGAVVDDGWSAAALRHFADSAVAAVAPLVIDVNCPTSVLTAGWLWMPYGHEVAYGEGQRAADIQAADANWLGPDVVAAFYRRSLFSEVGSLDATLLPQFAAIDLALRLRKAGYSAVLETASQAVISASHMPIDGAFREAWQRERLFWRHVDKPRSVRQLAEHGGLVIAETLRSLRRFRAVAHLAGCIVGVCDRRPPRLTRIAAQTREAVSIERRVDAQHDSPQSPLSATAGTARRSHHLAR